MLPAVDVTVKTVGGASPDEAPAALHSQPSPIPEAGSLRRPTAELAPHTTPEPLPSGRAGSEPKVSSDRCWTLRDPGSAQLRLTWLPPPSLLLPLPPPVYLPPSCCHAFLSLSFCPACLLTTAAQKMCVCVPTGPDYARARAGVQSNDKQGCDWRLRLQSKSHRCLLSLHGCNSFCLILRPLLPVDLFVHGCRFDYFFVKVAINVPGRDASTFIDLCPASEKMT